jgi:3-methyladenine DNA glycosylase/8-oxoguanine DNA glycosylase
MARLPHHHESAARLAKAAQEKLRPVGFDDYKIERLAEIFTSEGRGEDLDEFVQWAIAHVIEEDRERHTNSAG